MIKKNCLGRAIMSNKWIKFLDKNTHKELLRVSVEGTYEGEVENIKGLLAYERNISIEDIKVSIE